jgi:hypothetical protein
MLDTGTSWDSNETYYERSRTLKGQLLHHEVKNMTCDEEHVFREDYFYILARIQDGKKIYTWAKTFDEKTIYYRINENENGW